MFQTCVCVWTHWRQTKPHQKPGPQRFYGKKMVVVVARRYSSRIEEHMSICTKGEATLACYGERSDVLNKYRSERAANVGMANTDRRWNNKSQEKRDECKSSGEGNEVMLRPSALALHTLHQHDQHQSIYCSWPIMRLLIPWNLLGKINYATPHKYNMKRSTGGCK